MASNIVNFPYNSMGVARLDSNGVIHNHLYHECPIGRIDDNKIVHNHPTDNSLVGRIDGDNAMLAGSAYLLLIHNNR